MVLTSAQKQAIKADILANPDLNGQGDEVIAARYNLAAAPSFFVWRSSVPLDEIMLNGFDWTRVDNLSVGKARIWDWMFRQTGSIDPSKANIRTGIDAAWVGTAADLAVRAAVYAHCQRLASRLEKLFAVGAGTTVTNGSGPATMGFEGTISAQTVSDILAGF